MVTDLFAISAVVGTLPEHALVGNDSHGEVVDRDSVILTTHHFRCHVTRSTRGILRVLRVPKSGNSQISNAEIALLVEDQVLRLDVSMKNGVLVEVLEAEEHAGNEEFYRS